MSAILGRLTSRFILPGLGLKELIDLIRTPTTTDEEAITKANNLQSIGASRFAIVDLQNDVVIKFISPRKALLMSQVRRRRRLTRTKTVVINKDGCAVPV